MTAPAAAPRRILLGHVAGAHGIRGDVVIKAYTEFPEDIAAYGPLASEDGKRTLELTVVNVTPKGVIVRVKGVGDRNGAEALRGTALFVDRDRLPPAEDGSFYYEDLVGLEAKAEDGSLLGHIKGVHNFGAGDLIEVSLAGTGRTELIPFTDACVPRVDIAGGMVTVVPPPSVEAEGPAERRDDDGIGAGAEASGGQARPSRKS